MMVKSIVLCCEWVLIAFPLVPKGGGVFGGPFGEGKRGAAQDLLHDRRRWSRLPEAFRKVAEHPVGNLLGDALGDHGLAYLFGGNLLPRQLHADGLADEADLITL